MTPALPSKILDFLIWSCNNPTRHEMTTMRWKTASCDVLRLPFSLWQARRKLAEHWDPDRRELRVLCSRRLGPESALSVQGYDPSPTWTTTAMDLIGCRQRLIHAAAWRQEIISSTIKSMTRMSHTKDHFRENLALLCSTSYCSHIVNDEDVKVLLLFLTTYCDILHAIAAWGAPPPRQQCWQSHVHSMMWQSCDCCVMRHQASNFDVCANANVAEVLFNMFSEYKY